MKAISASIVVLSGAVCVSFSVLAPPVSVHTLKRCDGTEVTFRMRRGGTFQWNAFKRATTSGLESIK